MVLICDGVGTCCYVVTSHIFMLASCRLNWFCTQIHHVGTLFNTNTEKALLLSSVNFKVQLKHRLCTKSASVSRWFTYTSKQPQVFTVWDKLNLNSLIFQKLFHVYYYFIITTIFFKIIFILLFFSYFYLFCFLVMSIFCLLFLSW